MSLLPFKSQTLPRDPRRVVLAIALTLGTLTACYQQPNRFDQVQQETRGKAAVAKTAIPGSEFNRFFPKPDDEYGVIFTQEKPGFASADVTRKSSGDVIATLAVADTASTQYTDAAEKFKGSTEMLGGLPVADVGEFGTAVLVQDRLQVQVRSKDASLGKDQRKEWLGKFDLANMAQMVRTR
ncbi:MAG: hypothetical protein U0800_06165 [Isosphaeraceae bacterium]